MEGREGRMGQGGKFRREREASAVLFSVGTRTVVRNFRRGEVVGGRLSAVGRKRDGVGDRPGLEMLRPGNVRG